MTPHIEAKKTDVAPIVLMPGDPLRAKWIAETFLKNVIQINSVRNMLGYTGYYKDFKISVISHGMGIPSIGIYSYELFDPNKYDVKAIIRLGSCGSLDPNVNVRDIIIANMAFSESCYAKILQIPINSNVLFADPNLLAYATQVAYDLNTNPLITCVYSSDVFYNPENWKQTALRTNSKVVEMEAFGLYANAILFSKQALCLLTVSDSLVTNEAMNAIERQTSLIQMVKIGLETCVRFYR